MKPLSALRMNGAFPARANVRYWANVDWPLRIAAGQQRERRNLVENGRSGYGRAD